MYSQVPTEIIGVTLVVSIITVLFVYIIVKKRKTRKIQLVMRRGRGSEGKVFPFKGFLPHRVPRSVDHRLKNAQSSAVVRLVHLFTNTVKN